MTVKIERLPESRTIKITVGEQTVDIDGLDDIRTAIVRLEQFYDEVMYEIKRGNERKR